ECKTPDLFPAGRVTRKEGIHLCFCRGGGAPLHPFPAVGEVAVRLPGQNVVDESLLLIPDSAEELDGLERSRLHLRSLGCPLELWEILLLTQSGSWDPGRRTAPLPKGSASTPVHALQGLREAEGPFVRDLRFLLERVAAPMEIGC